MTLLSVKILCPNIFLLYILYKQYLARIYKRVYKQLLFLEKRPQNYIFFASKLYVAVAYTTRNFETLLKKFTLFLFIFSPHIISFLKYKTLFEIIVFNIKSPYRKYKCNHLKIIFNF